MNSEVRHSAGLDQLEISLRCYVPSSRTATALKSSELGPSEWSLIFDTETSTDARQRLKFGVYQVRKVQKLREAGFFIDPDILSKWEIEIIRSYSREIGYRCIRVEEFIEDIFFGIGYELRATIIGFNLPFDISRLAIGHGDSRGRSMKGGFSFVLSRDPKWPRIQVKHLSSRLSLIRFTTRRTPPRGMRKRKMRVLPRPGYFVDIRTFAAALTSRSFTLVSLANFLKTEHRKLSTDEECYCKLVNKYSEHGLTETPPHKVFSEASIGKAYFRKMNVRPWRQLQPDFPKDLIGTIMSTYFGGEPRCIIDELSRKWLIAISYRCIPLSAH
jgi:hypothetical protein